MPTCSPGGCTTASDGTVLGWYNTGSYQVATGNAIWPGPKGLNAEGQEYTDNGYLSVWPASGDGAGYITSMVSFLKSLGASFPFDINAHNGPPPNSFGAANVAYADSEAIVASANGVGFGMDSTSIDDGQQFATGIYPTTPTDWAHNFKAHPAPVHHLQMYEPGQTYFAAGYVISYIMTTGPTGSPANTAIINCSYDCSWFSGISGANIYVSGNSNPALNGVWPISCTSQCASNTLQFFSSVSANSYTGGIVWAPDYWPIVMPFAVQHNVSSIEVYECDLDFAFGTFSMGAGYPPDHPTTTWVTSPPTGSGCAAWGVQSPSASGYSTAATDAQIGQPSATSVRTGKSILIKGTQF
jgi:hypothetical protein